MSVSRAFVDLKISGAARRVEFDLPAGPVRPAELLPVFRQFSNAMVAAAEAAAPAPITCAPGCGACCRQLVPIRAMEARRLAAFTQALPSPRREVILARFAAARQRLDATGLRHRLDAREGLDAPARLQLKLDYFALGIPCPFLENESCGIYEERPMICREHLVTTPAAACANPSEGAIHTLPVHRADAAAAKLEASASPSAPAWIPLIDLLAWAASHPEDEASQTQDPRALIEQFIRDLSR